MNASTPPNSWVNNSMAAPQDPPRVAHEPGVDPASRSSGARIFVWPMRCATFSATRPITTARIVTIGQLLLFSTETGDAWLLDPADRLAARLARDGDSEPIHIEETDTTFAIGSKGRYRIEGAAFVYSDNDSGRVTTIFGYPTDQLAEIG